MVDNWLLSTFIIFMKFKMVLEQIPDGKYYYLVNIQPPATKKIYSG